ncbi:MAG: hypothetical protein KAJ56_01730 [Candidatus Aenigmarchaeota archaeon]|nr:hypothetical protein [Candidatus Aenigmarchaeota archaeon]
MSQIELTLEKFFSRNPDIRESRDKGLINRRALARYIADLENIPMKNFDALVMALRRYSSEQKTQMNYAGLFRSMRTSAKDSITVVCLRNSEKVLEKIPHLFRAINVGPNDTFKIVNSALTIKLFSDSSKLKQIKEHFDKDEILEIYDNVGEINIILSKDVINAYGVLSYITSQLSIHKINILELLTSTPELLLYVENKNLLKAYEVIKNM